MLHAHVTISRRFEFDLDMNHIVTVTEHSGGPISLSQGAEREALFESLVTITEFLRGQDLKSVEIEFELDA